MMTSHDTEVKGRIWFFSETKQTGSFCLDQDPYMERTFFLSPDPDPDRPKIRIRSGKFRNKIHEKKRPIIERTSLKKLLHISYLALSTLSFLVMFLKEHNLDPISFLKQNTEGSRSGFLKSGSRSAKKLGSIWIQIQNTGI